MSEPLTPEWTPLWRPRLVASDLDGTLLGPELVFDESTRAGVAALQSAGVTVVICTGRMFRSARRQAAELGLRSGPIVCYGGALVADLETGEWLRHDPIDGDVAAAVLRFARERDRHLNVFVDDRLHVEEDDRWTAWTTRHAEVDATLVDDLLPIVKRGPTKLVIATDPDDAARLAPEIGRRFAGKLRAATSLPHYIEINAAAVSKAGTLEWLRTERLHLAAERTVACGDGLNDVEMLAWAALGVAMEEGAEGARRVAQVVVPRSRLGALFEGLAAAPD